ncbi:MAG: GntR family transcriptional regulator [Lentisphaeria bacterium]|nr:GntR family transcriptional regulator [Lentisphaeria bacterium]
MGKIQDIIDILTQELNDGKYPPNSRFPSEYELSIRFGVGRITANKAVSALAAAGRLVRGSRGSGTRVSSGSLRSKGRIVFLGSIVQPNEVKTLRGTLRAAQNCGYTLEVANPIEQNLKNYLMQLNKDSSVIGIVTIGYENMPDEFSPDIPMVYLDMPDPEYHLDKHYIATPNEEAAKKMMEALIARGHREIVLYSSPRYQFQHTIYRIRGFQEAMRQAGIADVDKRIFTAVDYTDEDAVENLKKILKRYPKTTAIVTPSDDLVRTMLQAMNTLGISYPGPIALTGFGNLMDVTTRHGVPTVEQNHFQFGVQACASLIDFHEKRCEEIPHIQYVDYKMINMECIPRVSE